MTSRQRFLRALTTAAILAMTAAPARAETYSCGVGTGPLVDDGYAGTIGSMTCCTVEVPVAECTVTDADAAFALTHTFVGDLVLKVVSPAGTVTTVMNRIGFRPANWNSDLITFDDDGNDPSAGTMGAGLLTSQNVCEADGICAFTPEPDGEEGIALADFDGESAAGGWMLCAGDAAPVDLGTLDTGALTLSLDCGPADADGDGVEDDEDFCADTDADSSDPAAAVVDANGCSIAQQCPCAGSWKNHGAYVSCTARAVSSFESQGLIASTLKGDIVSTAARSSCGAKK